jgi:uncharacterized damage-inducible protein DinB
MTGRINWVHRIFNFDDIPVDLYPEMVERLRGLPDRAAGLVRGLPETVSTRQEVDGHWSIREHLGHLVSVDDLLEARLDDYDAGVRVLTAADMSNRRTERADYNGVPTSDILRAMGERRGGLVQRLEKLTPKDFGRCAHHPRLDKPMRTVDAVYFFAEHDVYHLARITELIRAQAGQPQ